METRAELRRRLAESASNHAAGLGAEDQGLGGDNAANPMNTDGTSVVDEIAADENERELDVRVWKLLDYKLS